jgi:opacity protein-like surface antigen
MMRLRVWSLAAFLVMLCAPPALADATAFIGVTPTPSSRVAKGVAAGITVLVVGFEFEYSDTVEDLEAGAPSLRSGMGNLIVQTPIAVSGLQFYGTVGGGIYRERLGEQQETNLGMNIGGGVKVSLLGPLKLRLDYRLFTLRGAPLHSKPQRVYAGLNLAF